MFWNESRIMPTITENNKRESRGWVKSTRANEKWWVMATLTQIFEYSKHALHQYESQEATTERTTFLKEPRGRRRQKKNHWAWPSKYEVYCFFWLASFPLSAYPWRFLIIQNLSISSGFRPGIRPAIKSHLKICVTLWHRILRVLIPYLTTNLVKKLIYH